MSGDTIRVPVSVPCPTRETVRAWLLAHGWIESRPGVLDHPPRWRVDIATCPDEEWAALVAAQPVPAAVVRVQS